MNMLLQFLTGKDRNIERNSFLWNILSSLCFSFQSAVLLLAVTRIGGLAIAGIFSITYSIGQMFAAIGDFNMRPYHVSDVKDAFPFQTYFTSRLFTVFLMAFACGSYSVINGYRGEKLALIALFSIYRMVDCMDDLYHGVLQKQGRLDIAERIMSTRIISSSAAFFLCFLLTRNLLVSACVMTLSALCISGFLNCTAARLYPIRLGFCFRGVGKLLLACLPICAGSFLYSYLVNAPKYAIEVFFSDEVQGAFNIIYLPVFVISMLSGFVFKPYLLHLGQYWNSGDRRKMAKLCLLLTGIILALSLAVVVGGTLLGIPVLKLVFGVDLEEYRSKFVLLLIFGCIAALNTFGSILLTIIRKQGFILPAYAAATLVEQFCMKSMTAAYGLTGTCLVFGMTMSIILIIYVCVIVLSLRPAKTK